MSVSELTCNVAIVAGVLLFVAHFLPVPYPKWLQPPPPPPPERPKRLTLDPHRAASPVAGPDAEPIYGPHQSLDEPRAGTEK